VDRFAGVHRSPLSGSTGHTVHSLGLDPSSHVARCEPALRAMIAAFGSPVSRAREAVACEGVHHGVYTP
jgi:hypothetical protein